MRCACVSVCVCVCVSPHVNVGSSIPNLIKFGMSPVIKNTLTSYVLVYLIMTWRNAQICKVGATTTLIASVSLRAARQQIFVKKSSFCHGNIFHIM